MADYTMQSSKGFNPFLMESDYSSQPAEPMYAVADTQSSNPFLTGFGAAPVVEQQPAPTYAPTIAAGTGGGGGENPFLSYSYPIANDILPAPTTTNAHNPFADFTDTSAASNSGANAYFGSAADMSYHHQTQEAFYEPQLIDTSQMSDSSGPHQTTKDLLESVTGALEATSDSLLDRLRVNAPSPTPELPSPTPSPRSPSPDLLFGDELPPVPPPSANPLAPSPHQFDSIIDLLDNPASNFSSAPQPNFSSSPKSSAEIMGLYSTVTTTTAKPVGAVVQEVQAQQQPLVDFVIEPATPKIISEQPAQVFPLPSPPKMLSPEKSPESEVLVAPPIPESKPPSHQPPPRPVSPTMSSPSETKVESPVIPPAPMIISNHEPPVRPTTVPVPPSPAKAPPPERPKPPPVPAPPVSKSPVHEVKPMPSRPPPPVPPAPRVSPHPAPVYPISTAPPTTQAFSPPAAEPQPVSTPPTTEPFPRPTQAFAPTTQAFAPTTQAFTTNEPPKQTFSSSEIFGSKPQADPFAAGSKTTKPTGGNDAFDAFDEKFEKLVEGETTLPTSTAAAAAFNDPFGGPPTITTTGDAAWGGGDSFGGGDASEGFGTADNFDSFLSLTEPPPVPQSTPAKIKKDGNDWDDNEEEKEMTITIRPRNDTDFSLALAPALAPPPKSPAAMSTGSAYSEENNTAFVPFLSSAHDTTYAEAGRQTQMHRTDSSETPQTPLYEEDTSQPLEDFPRTKYETEGWEMQIRLPNKKKITGQRFWKKVFTRIGHHNDLPVVQIYNNKGDKEPFQEIPLQPCYSVSDISAQQFDQYGKIFTAKIQYVFYKERPGVRPGQISKAGRLSHKLSAFAAYAITGDSSGVKEFGSDLKKLGLPLEHAPQISQMVKLGTQTFEDMKQFSVCIEEALFTLPVHRDRALNYKTEEIQVTIVDEYYVEQDIFGMVTRQIARVRLFFLSFLNGIAEIEMGVNDLRRQGKEIVGRHDIIPVPTEEWIRMENIEFSNVVQMDEFEATQTIKFKPPDACYLELMRFRVRPPKHRELPMQVKTTFISTGQRIEIRSDILVPGFTSRKLGQIPCEDVMVKFPIPETWIYMFRVEKHFRYGSVKSAHRRSGKVKGVERILGALDAVEPSLMETTSGQAKYEHQHRAIVWRIARLPKEGQGAYTTHSFFCHITLQAHEKIPDNLSKYCYVEFTMPHTTISHTVCRSISVPTSDEPPEKCCRYLSRHEYLVEIEHKESVAPGSYNIAAAAVPAKEEIVEEPVRDEFAEQKYDSDFSDD